MPKGKKGRTPCSVEGCNRHINKDGLCAMHRRRVERHGSINACKYKPSEVSFEDWFWTKVNKTDSCWLWTGQVARRRGGYGLFYNGEKKIKAHHWLVGIPDPGYHWHHKCEEPKCVNPDHLELLDEVSHGKLHGRPTHQQ